MRNSVFRTSRIHLSKLADSLTYCSSLARCRSISRITAAPPEIVIGIPNTGVSGVIVVSISIISGEFPNRGTAPCGSGDRVQIFPFPAIFGCNLLRIFRLVLQSLNDLFRLLSRAFQCLLFAKILFNRSANFIQFRYAFFGFAPIALER